MGLLNGGLPGADLRNSLNGKGNENEDMMKIKDADELSKVKEAAWT